MIIISGQSCHTFFFRGRLHLKINCANNKLTCEGKRRLIKMSRSQLFLIVSCFVSNSNSNIFPSGQTRLSFHQSQSDPNIPPIHFIIMPGILIEDQRKAFFFNILLCDNLFTKHCIPFFGNFQDMFFSSIVLSVKPHWIQILEASLGWCESELGNLTRADVCVQTVSPPHLRGLEQVGW